SQTGGEEPVHPAGYAPELIADCVAIRFPAPSETCIKVFVRVVPTGARTSMTSPPFITHAEGGVRPSPERAPVSTMTDPLNVHGGGNSFCKLNPPFGQPRGGSCSARTRYL